MFGEQEEEKYSKEIDGEGESALSQKSSSAYDASSAKKHTMRGLNKRYVKKDSESKSKPDTRDETDTLQHMRNATKTPTKSHANISGKYKSSESQQDVEESKLSPNTRLSKSKMISYQDPKYKGQNINKTLEKSRRTPHKYEEMTGEHIQNPNVDFYKHEGSGELSDEAHERLPKDKEQETPRSTTGEHHHLDSVSSSFKGGNLTRKENSENNHPSKSNKAGEMTIKTKKDPFRKHGFKSADRKTKNMSNAKFLRSPDRSEFDSSWRDPKSGHEFHSSTNVNQFKDGQNDNLEYEQDDPVQNPRAHSDHIQSMTDLHATNYVDNAEDGIRKDVKSYNLPKSIHKKPPMRSARGLKSQNEPHPVVSRRKSQYRQTKEEMKDKKRQDSTAQKESGKAVEVDITGVGRHPIDSSSIHERYGRSSSKLSDQKYHTQSSGNASEGNKGFKTVQPKDYEKGHRYDSSKPQQVRRSGSFSKEESPKMYEEGKNRHTGVVGDEGMHDYQDIHNDFNDDVGKAHEDTYRIPKDYSPSKKKYDLKKRIQKGKSDRSNLEEHELDHENRKIGVEDDYDIKDVKNSSSKTPSKSYNLAKGLKNKKLNKSPQSKNSAAFVKQNTYSSSEERKESLTPTSKAKLYHQSSGSMSSKNNQQRKLGGYLSDSKKKSSKADSKKGKLTHASMNKLGHKQPSQQSLEKDTPPADQDQPIIYKKKYDIKNKVEKANAEKLKKKQAEYQEESKKSQTPPLKSDQREKAYTQLPKSKDGEQLHHEGDHGHPRGEIDQLKNRDDYATSHTQKYSKYQHDNSRQSESSISGADIGAHDSPIKNQKMGNKASKKNKKSNYKTLEQRATPKNEDSNEEDKDQVAGSNKHTRHADAKDGKPVVGTKIKKARAGSDGNVQCESSSNESQGSHKGISKAIKQREPSYYDDGQMHQPDKCNEVTQHVEGSHSHYHFDQEGSDRQEDTHLEGHEEAHALNFDEDIEDRKINPDEYVIPSPTKFGDKFVYNEDENEDSLEYEPSRSLLRGVSAMEDGQAGIKPSSKAKGNKYPKDEISRIPEDKEYIEGEILQSIDAHKSGQNNEDFEEEKYSHSEEEETHNITKGSSDRHAQNKSHKRSQALKDHSGEIKSHTHGESEDGAERDSIYNKDDVKGKQIQQQQPSMQLTDDVGNARQHSNDQNISHGATKEEKSKKSDSHQFKSKAKGKVINNQEEFEDQKSIEGNQARLSNKEGRAQPQIVKQRFDKDGQPIPMEGDEEDEELQLHFDAKAANSHKSGQKIGKSKTGELVDLAESKRSKEKQKILGKQSNSDEELKQSNSSKHRDITIKSDYFEKGHETSSFEGEGNMSFEKDISKDQDYEDSIEPASNKMSEKHKNSSKKIKAHAQKFSRAHERKHNEFEDENEANRIQESEIIGGKHSSGKPSQKHGHKLRDHTSPDGQEFYGELEHQSDMHDETKRSNHPSRHHSDKSDEFAGDYTTSDKQDINQNAIKEKSKHREKNRSEESDASEDKAVIVSASKSSRKKNTFSDQEDRPGHHLEESKHSKYAPKEQSSLHTNKDKSMEKSKSKDKDKGKDKNIRGRTSELAVKKGLKSDDKKHTLSSEEADNYQPQGYSKTSDDENDQDLSASKNPKLKGSKIAGKAGLDSEGRSQDSHKHSKDARMSKSKGNKSKEDSDEDKYGSHSKYPLGDPTSSVEDQNIATKVKDSKLQESSINKGKGPMVSHGDSHDFEEDQNESDKYEDSKSSLKSLKHRGKVQKSGEQFESEHDSQKASHGNRKSTKVIDSKHTKQTSGKFEPNDDRFGLDDDYEEGEMFEDAKRSKISTNQDSKNSTKKSKLKDSSEHVSKTPSNRNQDSNEKKNDMERQGESIRSKYSYKDEAGHKKQSDNARSNSGYESSQRNQTESDEVTNEEIKHRDSKYSSKQGKNKSARNPATHKDNIGGDTFPKENEFENNESSHEASSNRSSRYGKNTKSAKKTSKIVEAGVNSHEDKDSDNQNVDNQDAIHSLNESKKKQHKKASKSIPGIKVGKRNERLDSKRISKGTKGKDGSKSKPRDSEEGKKEKYSKYLDKNQEQQEDEFERSHHQHPSLDQFEDEGENGELEQPTNTRFSQDRSSKKDTEEQKSSHPSKTRQQRIAERTAKLVNEQKTPKSAHKSQKKRNKKDQFDGSDEFEQDQHKDDNQSDAHNQGKNKYTNDPLTSKSASKGKTKKSTLEDSKKGKSAKGKISSRKRDSKNRELSGAHEDTPESEYNRTSEHHPSHGDSQLRSSKHSKGSRVDSKVNKHGSKQKKIDSTKPAVVGKDSHTKKSKRSSDKESSSIKQRYKNKSSDSEEEESKHGKLVHVSHKIQGAQSDDEYEFNEENERQPPNKYNASHGILGDEADIFRHSRKNKKTQLETAEFGDETQPNRNSENIRDSAHGYNDKLRKPKKGSIINTGEKSKRNARDQEDSKRSRLSKHKMQASGTPDQVNDKNASFEYDQFDSQRDSQNVFYEEGKDYENIKLKKPRKINTADKKQSEDDTTGKFGDKSSARFGGSASKFAGGKQADKTHKINDATEDYATKDEEFISGKKGRDDFIKNMAKDRRTERMQKFLPNNQNNNFEEEEDEGSMNDAQTPQLAALVEGSGKKSKAQQRLKKEINKRSNQQLKDSTEKSLRDQLFDIKESRIDSQTDTLIQDQKQLPDNIHGSDLNRGSFYNIGNHHMRNDR